MLRSRGTSFIFTCYLAILGRRGDFCKPQTNSGGRNVLHNCLARVPGTPLAFRGYRKADPAKLVHRRFRSGSYNHPDFLWGAEVSLLLCAQQKSVPDPSAYGSKSSGLEHSEPLPHTGAVIKQLLT